MTKFELNIGGKLRSFDGPQVMGIVNVTPDSFWEGSRMGRDADKIRARACDVLAEGGTMLDVGAYSTRPGAPDVSPTEELDRLTMALSIIRQEVGKEVPVSVDTFRADVAEACIRELGANIINDISGGTLDARMFQVVAQTGAPYILMHMRGTPQNMQQHTDYPEGVTQAVIRFFEEQMGKLQQEYNNSGQSGKAQEQNIAAQCGSVQSGLAHQLILDPGYGFAKTLVQNYELMHDLPKLCEAFPQQPMLVGISRKSMIYRLLNADPAHALNGTTVLNTFALEHGASILRVHDVREAVEAVRIVGEIKGWGF